MERLTERLPNGVIRRVEVNDENRGENVMSRLAAYEDTGMEPEEIKDFVSRWKEATELAGLFKEAGIDRLRELAEADKDGRCVVLPCKDGDDVFSFRWNIKAQKYEICTGKIKNVRHDTDDGLVTVSDGERYCIWRKTAFSTREAAEAALKAGDHR